MHFNRFDGDRVESTWNGDDITLVGDGAALRLREETGVTGTGDTGVGGTVVDGTGGGSTGVDGTRICGTGVDDESGWPETSAFHLATKSCAEEIRENLDETEVLFHSWFFRDNIIRPFSQQN